MKRFSRTGLVLAICLVSFLLVGGLVWFGVKADANEDRTDASFKIGVTETRNNLSSTSSSSSSGQSTFNSRHVLLVNANPHPLSQRIGTLLAQQFKDSPQIEQIETADGSDFLPEGAAAPDLFLRVDLVNLEEDGLLSRSLKATVAAFLGSAPWQSSHYVQDSTTPPLVQFRWNATLESESVFNGVRGDRYGDAARSMADEFAKGINKQLEDFSAKYPALPELPAEFYGPYEPVADFDFLKELKAQRVCSYYSLLTHNETFWSFLTANDPVSELQRIIGQLEAAEWKLYDATLRNTENHYVRLSKPDTVLEIFRLKHDGMPSLHPAKEEMNKEFIAHYRKAFSRVEREAALEKLFAERRPIEALLPFYNSFSTDQRDRFYALVEKTPGTSPRAYLQLAENYLHRKQTDSALNMLRRAKALAMAVNDPSTSESDIQKVARKISPKERLDLEVTPEVCRELGFLEITEALQTFEVERDLGQPLPLFGDGGRGLKICSLTIHTRQKDAYAWTRVSSEKGSRSFSSGSYNDTALKNWQQTFDFDRQSLRVTPLLTEDKKRVNYTIQVER